MSDQECRDISFHPEPNALFHLPGYNPCRNPSCRMHACDQGIFKKLLDMVTQQIKLESTSVRTEFENRCQFASPFNCVILFLTCRRWAQLFKFPNYRIFKTGVLNLKMVSVSTSLHGDRVAVCPQWPAAKPRFSDRINSIRSLALSSPIGKIQGI